LFSMHSVYPEPRRVSSVPSVLILAFLFSLLLLSSSGCGGGGSQSQIAQTPGPQDFAITLSSNSLSVPQGGASSPVNVLVNPQNGFAGSVQVTLSGLPSRVVFYHA